jgi:hypothetical protein
VQSAAKGALALPADEMIEILVYLALHNKVHGQLARFTLAGWEEKSALAVAFNPNTPAEVLDYLISPDNLRPRLLPALLENPSVKDDALVVLAASGSREVVEAMANSARVRNSPAVQKALACNPHFKSADFESNQTNPDTLPGTAATGETGSSEAQDTAGAVLPESAQSNGAAEDVLDEDVATFMREHADEIAAEEGKPFQAIGGIFDGLESVEAPQPTTAAAATPESTPTKPAEPTVTPRVPRVSPDEKRGGALQKISKLDIKGRIQVAMKGNKEERSILIRDGTKIVALAVLDSPKITDGEVEGFASQKNVLEAVLRAIPMKRRFAKHYPVIRNLVFNPRTPLDLSLGLMKNLLVNDLRNLSSNKEVSETIRKLALKMFKQKMEPAKKG